MAPRLTFFFYYIRVIHRQKPQHSGTFILVSARMTVIFSGGCMICQKYVQIFENGGREVRNFVVVASPSEAVDGI